MLIISCLPADAGDLLRRGAGGPQASGGGASGASPAAVETQSLRVNAQDRLARTSKALQDVQAMQRAVNESVSKSVRAMSADQLRAYVGRPVADGIHVDGLDPDSPRWVGAIYKTSSSDPNDVTIQQKVQSAMLFWKKFNVGPKTRLTFDQSAGGSSASEWIAYNKIEDASLRPSDILGTIRSIGTDGTTATGGQVYIINPNGIIFHGSAQVDTHALVASSLPLNENLRKGGLLVTRKIGNEYKQEFLFSGLDLDKLDDFDPASSRPSNGLYGSVEVKKGAKLSSPTNANRVGGRIILVGPKVTNQGHISTPDGQTILAAGLQVAVAAHSEVDAALRGLDVYVGKVADEPTGQVLNTGAGTVVNDGLIEAARGNVTLTGKDVTHNGAIESSSSVSLNGSILLSAGYDSVPYADNYAYRPLTSGQVTLGANSQMRIVPASSDPAAPEKIAGGELALKSSVSLWGKTIQFGNDSTVYVPSGSVNVFAGEWWPAGEPASGGRLENQFVFTGLDNQIYLGRGAMIDVAGLSGVNASVADNFVEVELRGAELADSPLLRNNPALRGQKVIVDIRDHGAWDPTLNNGVGGFTWIGTPLADAAGYANLVQRTVEQLSTSGGKVNMRAGGSIAMQVGATVDVSGGWTDYAGAAVETSKVLYQGKWIDISGASANQFYTGIRSTTTTVADAKWGSTDTWSAPRLSKSYQAGYQTGGDGGALAITAPAVALDGNLVGQTRAGLRQVVLRPTGSGGTSYSALPNDYLPVLSSLSLSLTKQTLPYVDVEHTLSVAPTVVISSGSKISQTPVGGFEVVTGNQPNLPTNRIENVVLSPDLFIGSGFGQLTLNNPAGEVAIESNLNLPDGGKLLVNSANINLADSVQITAPGGSLAFVVNNLTPEEKARAVNPLETLNPVTSPVAGRGEFTTGTNVTLSTSGKVIDLSSKTEKGLPESRLIDGGSISIKGMFLDFGDNTKFDVSGGAMGTSAASVSWGKGGGIAIDGGRETKDGTTIFTSGQWSGFENLKLAGYSGKQGGSLNLVAPFIQLGGAGLLNGEKAADKTTLWIKDMDRLGNLAFFSRGGFSQFSLSGFSGLEDRAPAVRIVEGTRIVPTVWNWGAQWGESGMQLTPFVPEDGVRTPINLTFKAIGVRSPIDSAIILSHGDLIMEKGTLIETDPGATAGVTLEGTTVAVHGKIVSPGGAISITGGKSIDVFNSTTQALVTVEIGTEAELTTAGKAWWKDASGYRVGSVLAGGKIDVTGNIVARAGARLDVSGASEELDVWPEQTVVTNLASTDGKQRVRTRIDSNGGKITFSGTELLVLDATLVGKAGLYEGKTSAQGGQLVIKAGNFAIDTSSVFDPTNTFDLAVNQSNTGLSVGRDVLRRSLVDDDKTGGSATAGYLAVDRFGSGGFGSINLKGAVQFNDDVALSASHELVIADKGVVATENNARVTLTAPYVYLGRAFIGPLSLEQEKLALDKLGLVNSKGNALDSVNFTAGTGELTINSSAIDLGSLALIGFNQANLNALGGDLRGDGTLSMAGKLEVDAANVYPQTAGRLNLVAYDDTLNGDGQIGGKIWIKNTSPVISTPPLSAGGVLGVYAPTIVQSGVLRAPMGSIVLGKPADSAAKDLISQNALPDTKTLTLEAGSITSVSARVDANTALVLPYGVNLNGDAWIDPTSTDISQGGVPEKTVSLSTANLTQEAGATIDVSGGGDLLAYRWVSGLGGTKDILASTGSFAVVPGYTSLTNATAPYNTEPSPTNDNLGSSGKRDAGYVNSSLAVGDRIFLAGVPGLAAGKYTLLPARYALLPGAFLVTPKSGTPPTDAVATPAYYDNTDKSVLSSYLVRGYRFNGLDASTNRDSLFSVFEVASRDVVLKRAQYDLYQGSEYLASMAEKAEAAVPRLPQDAGRVLLAAQEALNLRGTLTAFVNKGRGSEADISAQDIVIGKAEGDTTGKLVLDPTSLNKFGAESLLIGGIRGSSTEGRTVNVTATQIEVSNTSTTALTGPEIILAATETVVLTAGSAIAQSGVLKGKAETLTIGKNSTTSTGSSGNGVLLRVTSDADAGVIRRDFGASSALLLLSENASITGSALMLDSSSLLKLDKNSKVAVDNLNLSNRQINIRFSGEAGTEREDGLLLTGELLKTVQNSTRRLSLNSYTSIDLYGSGSFGSITGLNYSWDSLALHAGSIRGFDALGQRAATDADATVQFSAKQVTLDNRWSATGRAATESGLPTAGVLSFQAQDLTVAGHDGAAGDAGSSAAADHILKLAEYGRVNLRGTKSVQLTGTGQIEVPGTLAIETPQLSGKANSDQTLKAGDAFSLTTSNAEAVESVASDLGAKLAIVGKAINLGTGTLITAKSGTVDLRATATDLNIAGKIDVGGTSRVFQKDLGGAEYTDAGQINLTADQGNIAITTTGVLDLSAAIDMNELSRTDEQRRVGSAGALSAKATGGVLTVAGMLNAQGGDYERVAGSPLLNDNTQGGTFILDLKQLGTTHALDAILNNGGFTKSQSIRVRDGNVVLDGLATAHSYNLSADTGRIAVTNLGRIDASGKTGGSIRLAARDDVILESAAKLNASGEYYDNAGKGGSVSLESTTGYVDVRDGSEIDLRVSNERSISDEFISNGVYGNRTDLVKGTLHLRAPQIVDAAGMPQDVKIKPIEGTVVGASSIVVEGYRQYDLTDSSGGYISDSLKTTIKDDAAAYIAKLGSIDDENSITHRIAAKQDLSLLHFQPGVEILNKANASAAPVAINGIELANGATSDSLTGTNTIAVMIKNGSTITLNTSSSSINPPASAALTFGSAVAANTFRYSVPAGTTVVTITKPDGTITKVTYTKATANVALAAQTAGTSISFSKAGSQLTPVGTTAAGIPIALDVGTYSKIGSGAATVSASAGNLTLLNTWDLSSYRFNNEPGILTLRATGNLVFPATTNALGTITTGAASLSDGFDPTLSGNGTATNKLWLAPLMSAKSWSYRLVSGADVGAADFRQVKSMDQLAANSGSLLLGQGSANLPTTSTSATLRDSLLAGTTTTGAYFQTIRTGTGDIDVVTGRNVELLNPVATIYTAGRTAAILDGFDVPVLATRTISSTGAAYGVYYGTEGGNLSLSAQGSIVRRNSVTQEDASSLQMPTHWLYRRGVVGADGSFVQTSDGETLGTTWWVDYSNFFDDVASLGGGNVVLQAGQDVRNVNASVATNARLPGSTPVAGSLRELGGGDLTIVAGANIDGGVYYVERGSGSLNAAGSIKTNATRFAGADIASVSRDASINQLPTTLFVGKATFELTAGGDLTLGGVANPFLTPQALTNQKKYGDPLAATPYRTFFSTYDAMTAVSVASLGGEVTVQGDGATGALNKMYKNVFDNQTSSPSASSIAQPWIRTLENPDGFSNVLSLLPGTFRVAAFSGDINLSGNVYLAPAATGTLELKTAGALNGYQPLKTADEDDGKQTWKTSRINLSDASSTLLPSVDRPLKPLSNATAASLMTLDLLFDEDESIDNLTLAQKEGYHVGPRPLHENDAEPVRLYADSDLSGITLFAGKPARVLAGRDITDVGFYLQNNTPSAVSVIAAGRDLIPYAPSSLLRREALAQGGLVDSSDSKFLHNLEISGPGQLEVLAGRDLNLGLGSNATGIKSIANERNPSLSAQGASLIVAAGLGSARGLDANEPDSSQIAFASFAEKFLNPATAPENAKSTLPFLTQLMGLSETEENGIWTTFKNLSGTEKARLELAVFQHVLRETGREYGNPDAPGFRSYKKGRDAIAALFPTDKTWAGNINFASKEVRTVRGGDITLLAPGGKIDLGFDTPKSAVAPPGVITGYGGNISIFADQSVSVGALRIFTLRGGDVTIWSDRGNIAAGFSSKTIQSAPPTKVLIDSQSADVKNDLSGLATGGGIGVLATVAGVEPGDVDLIAPSGTIDAGDAGIRSSGRVTVSALVIANSANIQSSAGTTGAPVAVSAGLGSVASAAASSSASAVSSASDVGKRAVEQTKQVPPEMPSIISVEVIGYGGGEGEELANRKEESTNG